MTIYQYITSSVLIICNKTIRWYEVYMFLFKENEGNIPFNIRLEEGQYTFP